MLETLGPLPSKAPASVEKVGSHSLQWLAGNPYRSHVDELFGKRRNALYDERNKEVL